MKFRSAPEGPSGLRFLSSVNKGEERGLGSDSDALGHGLMTIAGSWRRQQVLGLVDK